MWLQGSFDFWAKHCLGFIAHLGTPGMMCSKFVWIIKSTLNLATAMFARTMAVFIIFPKLETRFNTHYQNAYANAFRNEFLELLHLSSNSIASTSREEGLVTAQLHCAVLPVEQRSCRARTFTYRSVGDINTFQNDFVFIISTETCFWLKRVTDRTFSGVSERLF